MSSEYGKSIHDVAKAGVEEEVGNGEEDGVLKTHEEVVPDGVDGGPVRTVLVRQDVERLPRDRVLSRADKVVDGDVTFTVTQT